MSAETAVRTEPDRKTLSPLLRGLRRILQRQYILTSEEALKPFECDGLSVYRELPLVAVLPGNTKEVRAILKLCHELSVPVVTRGAGTGLSAGALPHREGLLLVLSRLDSILRIDAENSVAVVQPGVRNLAISEAARPHNLFYAPDPSSQIACTVGGNVAENAGGIHCLKYGLTVHNVLQLKVLTLTGEELLLNANENNGGFNFLSLMIGSEGMLGVITEITVRLLPLPAVTRTLLASFDSIDQAGQAVSNIIAAGIIPAALEMMDNRALCAAEDFVQAGYPRDAAAILLIDLDGSESHVEQEGRRIQDVLRESGLRSLQTARSERERQLFWKGRKSAFPAVGRLAPDYYCMDGTIPRHALAEVLNHIHDLEREYKLPVANVFHAGDGNLHPLILFDANIPGELERVEAMGGKILHKCIEVGGTITGEHGVGFEKIRQMPLQFSDTEISLFHAIKQACDPDSLLNPDKNIPLLKHCQEYRNLAGLSHPRMQHEEPVLSEEETAVRQLRERLLDACADHRLICVDGNQSKSFLGRPLEGEVLNTRHYTGILRYEPTELVVTARAGTTLLELETVLAEHGQCLACEPPHFGAATVGGMIGAGLAGPLRPHGGSVSDQVLGCRVLTGKGEVLRFGGQVMKNVAGYDVSRLLSGSMGCLGIILETTLRVIPCSAASRSFRFAIEAEKTSAFVNKLRQAGFPVTASCHDGSQLVVRFSGSAGELDPLEQQLKKQFSFVDIEEECLADFWSDLKEQRSEFFRQKRNLWRILVPPASPRLLLEGNTLTEWHGALRWLSSDASADEVFSTVAGQGGSACLFRADRYRREEGHAGRFQPLSAPLMAWHRQLKRVFDPDEILNHGRMYNEF